VAVAVRVEGAVALLGEFAEEIEAALCATYGRDPLAEFYRGDITARALRVLIDGLPPTSAYANAVQGHTWRDTELILHQVDWQLRQLNAHISNLFRPDGTDPIQPEPLATPFDDREVIDDVRREHTERQKQEALDMAARITGN
jgi:hypothetical protein